MLNKMTCPHCQQLFGFEGDYICPHCSKKFVLCYQVNKQTLSMSENSRQ